jgi:hypothetical protein
VIATTRPFHCLDEDGKSRTIKGIPKVISVRKILSLQLKKCFRKGCQLYATHILDSTKDNGPKLEDYHCLAKF